MNKITFEIDDNNNVEFSVEGKDVEKMAVLAINILEGNFNMEIIDGFVKNLDGDDLETFLGIMDEMLPDIDDDEDPVIMPTELFGEKNV